MNVSIELDSSSGHLGVTFFNPGSKTVKVRDLYPQLDVVVENDEGDRAEFYLSMPYGAKVKTIVLAPGASHRTSVNLASDFVYSKEGSYTVWIDYDSSKKTAKFDVDTVDSLQSKSNAIRFPIVL